MSNVGHVVRRRRSSVVRRGSLVGSPVIRRGSIVGSPVRDGRRMSTTISQEDCGLLHLAPSVQRFWQVTQNECLAHEREWHWSNFSFITDYVSYTARSYKRRILHRRKSLPSFKALHEFITTAKDIWGDGALKSQASKSTNCQWYGPDKESTKSC